MIIVVVVVNVNRDAAHDVLIETSKHPSGTRRVVPKPSVHAFAKGHSNRGDGDSRKKTTNMTLDTCGLHPAVQQSDISSHDVVDAVAQPSRNIERLVLTALPSW